MEGSRWNHDFFPQKSALLAKIEESQRLTIRDKDNSLVVQLSGTVTYVVRTNVSARLEIYIALDEELRRIVFPLLLGGDRLQWRQTCHTSDSRLLWQEPSETQA